VTRRSKSQGRIAQRAPLLLTIPASTERITMLNRKSPLTLAATLTIRGQGEEFPVEVVFNNHTKSQIDARQADTEAKAKAEGKDDEWVMREMFRFIVKSFDGNEPTQDGIKQLEEEWPGSVVGVFHKYHEARRVEVVKN
jgi:hypothetical protein